MVQALDVKPLGLVVIQAHKQRAERHNQQLSNDFLQNAFEYITSALRKYSEVRPLDIRGMKRLCRNHERVALAYIPQLNA
jgi:hypothetical protein